ncbi:MAG: DUF368 domain-containing protein [Gammaproteobacteria bacterium]
MKLYAPLVTLAKGFCMGAADVVPGVSGGTMAFILGIYRRLIDAIRAFDLTALKLLSGGRIRAAVKHVELVFLLWLGAGIVCALVFFTRVVPLPTLIRTDPVPVYALFFGLIVGSVVVLMRGLKNLGAGDAVALLTGVALGLAIVNVTPAQTPEASWFIFVCGGAAVCAMILPGISGSFILLLLRKYAYIFDALGRLDFSVVVPFALGAATGLMLFSRVLSWLMAHFERSCLLVIAGLLVGSLWIIWPYQQREFEMVRGKERLLTSMPVWPDAFDDVFVLALALALAGFVGVVALERLSTRRLRHA